MLQCCLAGGQALTACLGAQESALLNGTWTLQYTSNSELSGLLALSRLPFVSVETIQQIIDTGTMTAENKVRCPARVDPKHCACIALYWALAWLCHKQELRESGRCSESSSHALPQHSDRTEPSKQHMPLHRMLNEYTLAHPTRPPPLCAHSQTHSSCSQARAVQCR